MDTRSRIESRISPAEGDYKDVAALRSAAILAEVGAVLRSGKLPYRAKRNLARALRAMPDGADAPRAFAEWRARHEDKLVTLCDEVRVD